MKASVPAAGGQKQSSGLFLARAFICNLLPARRRKRAEAFHIPVQYIFSSINIGYPQWYPILIYRTQKLKMGLEGDENDRRRWRIKEVRGSTFRYNAERPCFKRRALKKAIPTQADFGRCGESFIFLFFQRHIKRLCCRCTLRQQSRSSYPLLV